MCSETQRSNFTYSSYCLQKRCTIYFITLYFPFFQLDCFLFLFPDEAEVTGSAQTGEYIAVVFFPYSLLFQSRF